MKLRERVVVRGSADKVWQLLADPARWLAWHHKLVHVRRNRVGFVLPGEQFHTKWKLKRREEEGEILVQEVNPGRLLKLRQFSSHKNRIHILEITFELNEHPQGVEVRQVTDFSRAGIPLFWRGMLWVIHRFGKPVGPQILERLKELAETGATTPV